MGNFVACRHFGHRTLIQESLAARPAVSGAGRGNFASRVFFPPRPGLHVMVVQVAPRRAPGTGHPAGFRRPFEQIERRLLQHRHRHHEVHAHVLVSDVANCIRTHVGVGRRGREDGTVGILLPGMIEGPGALVVHQAQRHFAGALDSGLSVLLALDRQECCRLQCGEPPVAGSLFQQSRVTPELALERDQAPDQLRTPRSRPPTPFPT